MADAGWISKLIAVPGLGLVTVEQLGVLPLAQFVSYGRDFRASDTIFVLAHLRARGVTQVENSPRLGRGIQ
jgi:hypothetical protein